MGGGPGWRGRTLWRLPLLALAAAPSGAGGITAGGVRAGGHPGRSAPPASPSRLHLTCAHARQAVCACLFPERGPLGPLSPPADSFGPKRKKGDDEDDGGKGIVHDDVWCLDLKSLAFERVKKQGRAPAPTRLGAHVRSGRQLHSARQSSSMPPTCLLPCRRQAPTALSTLLAPHRHGPQPSHRLWPGDPQEACHHVWGHPGSGGQGGAHWRGGLRLRRTRPKPWRCAAGLAHPWRAPASVAGPAHVRFQGDLACLQGDRVFVGRC